MQKIYILILMILMLFLTSCINKQTFEFDMNRVRSSEDIITILDQMMIQGDHDDTTVVLHNLISGSFYYKEGKFIVDQIAYNVYKNTKNIKSNFQEIRCINQQNGKLTCTEEVQTFQMNKQYETITLGEVKQYLTNADIPKLLSTLEEDNAILEYDSMFAVFVFESFSNKTVTLGNNISSSTIYINNELILEGDVTLDGVVMWLQVVYAKAEDAQVFQIYIEN